MSEERIDLGAVEYPAVTANGVEGRAFIAGPEPVEVPSILRPHPFGGELTPGGLAEAGWFDAGRIVGDGPVFEPDTRGGRLAWGDPRREPGA